MQRATKTRSFSFPDAIWRRFWSPRRAIRLSRALALVSPRALEDFPGAPGASRGRHETLPRHRLNVLGQHGVLQKAPRINFRSSAWRWPHRFRESLISCEPADTVERPCGPAHTKQGCLSIRVACAYPNAHGRDSLIRAPFGPRGSPGAPGASRGRREPFPRRFRNALGRHGVSQGFGSIFIRCWVPRDLAGSILIDFRVDFRVAFASDACLFCRLSLHTLSAQPAHMATLTARLCF